MLGFGLDGLWAEPAEQPAVFLPVEVRGGGDGFEDCHFFHSPLLYSLCVMIPLIRTVCECGKTPCNMPTRIRLTSPVPTHLLLSCNREIAVADVKALG